ncbi:MAG: hypothetical protein ACRCUY_03425 [Thermoguttaceae bacterium]
MKFHFSFLTNTLAILVLSILLSFFATSVLAQKMPTDSFPSVEETISALTGDAGKDFTLTDTLDTILSDLSAGNSVKNTEESVRSAIDEGQKLVTEEVIPEINLVVVESVDKRTKRYSPRIDLNFVEFPLRDLTRAVPSFQKEDDQEFPPQEIMSIVERIEQRLKLTSVQCKFSGRTITLTGTAPSVRSRDLFEMMLRLEPGIDTIKNEICIE